MPALPVIADVFRCSVIWSSSVGDPVMVNVFHLLSNGTVTPGDVAGEIDAQANNDMFSSFNNSITANELQIIPLNGVTPTSVWPLTNWAGTFAGGETVPGVGGVVSIRTNQRGPRGRGRIFLPGISEDVLDNGFMDAGVRDTTVNGWEVFADDLQGTSGELEMGVASYKFEEFYVVQAMSMNLLPGIIRSRRN